ncbi:MAG TPA: hypothetical protein VKU85_04845, partial [bacterium]|nr:hypothetical protein [bacterium]
VAMVAAAAGGVRSAVAGPRAERAVAAATGGVLLVALARLGADPEALAGVMPGAAILAAGLAARVRPAAAGPALAAAVAVALLAPPAVGAIRDLGAYAGSSSLEQAEVWIRDRVPDESVLLVEESRLHLPTPEGVAEMEALAAAGTVSPSRRQAYVGNGHTFRTLPLPPSTPNPLERALFYDPNLAKRFAYLVLTELPPVEREVATERTPIELLTARRLFHEYFRESWRQEARFESGRENEPDLIVLGRPEGFEPDLESLGKLGYVLLRDPLLTLREESSAFTDWALEAGRALLAVGDLPAARAYLGMVTERDSTRVEGRLEHARVLTLLGEPARAKREVLLGLSEDPYHGGLHLHMGALLEQEGDFRGAAVEYGAAAAQMADPSIPMAQLGQLLFRMGESEAAHSQLDLLEERHPDAPATRALREFLGSP